MASLSSTDILNLGFDTTANAHKILIVDSAGNVIKVNEIIENRLGSEATGVSGATGRVLTLTNTSESGNPVAVWVESSLRNQANFTFTHNSASSTITFDSIEIFDADRIKVSYYI